MARKTAESDDGILKLDWSRLPGLEDYHRQVTDDIAACRYPGSPLLVKRLLRPGDKAWLFEMHPQTIRELRQNCEQRRVCHVRQEDGFNALSALLPTASHRALVLIDPSYEVKSDYRTVVKVTADALSVITDIVHLDTFSDQSLYLHISFPEKRTFSCSASLIILEEPDTFSEKFPDNFWQNKFPKKCLNKTAIL